jgi:hypothetical protein
MVLKEFSFLDQNSENITQVFDLIAKAIKNNILLLFALEFGFQIFLGLESVQKISRLLFSSLSSCQDISHPARARG